MNVCLSARGVAHDFGTRRVLSIPSLEIYEGEKIGLVGENGAGKTTLLRILAGVRAPDEGQVRARVKIAYLPQMGGGDDGDAESDLRARFGAPEARNGLSGGEKTRRRIARALSGRPGLLLADEPTTDLDEAGARLLESELAAFPGALVLVSHDSALLDALVTQIWHLEDGGITVYPGNYTDFRRELANRRDYQQFEYDQYRGEQSRLRRAIQGEKEHAAGVIKLPSRMGNSEARLHRRSATEVEEKLHKTRKALETRLKHLEEKERPKTDPEIAITLGDSGGVVSKTAVSGRGITIRFGDRTLLEDAEFALPTRSRTALLGPNGCGKTTLVNLILSGDPRVSVRPGVKIAFLAQDPDAMLEPDKTTLENAMADSKHPQSAARTVLARLTLAGDDVFKRAGVLSGGERVKVALARLVLGDSNLLVLDEPTNHLDIFSLEALAGVLSLYAGTLLLVSHDRAFVEQVATRLILFEGTKLVSFEGKPSERAAQARRRAVDPQTEIERTRAEMRLAEIAARMAAPRKGDDPETLKAAYEEALALRDRIGRK